MKKLLKTLFATMFAITIFTACEDVPEPYTNPNSGNDETTEAGVYLSEPLTSTFGTFEVKTIKGIDWKISHNTATATGYVDKVNTESESYLISPEMNLSSSKGAYLQFEYILAYDNNEGNNKVLITDNYSGDPKTTTWTDITGKLSGWTKDWNVFTTYAEAIPTQFIGKEKVRIAFYYDATANGSRTWEIRNVLVKEGAAPEGGTTDPQTGDNGAGVYTNPYNVDGAIAATAATGQWVKGYIVGCVNDKSITESSVFDAGTFTNKTNILIATSKDEKTISKCMPVQLPAGDLRTLLNLVDNAGNLKQEVLIYGEIAKYFGVPGLKSPTYAEINGTKIGTFPTEEPTGTSIFSETFEANQGNFTIVDVNLSGNLTYIWKWNSYKYMKASAYIDKTNNAAESWLISPAIDMSKVNAATLSFEQALNFLNGKERSNFVSVMISTNYTSGMPSSASWEELNISQYPAGTDWTFITSTTDLAKYAGKANVRIAFKYVSTTETAPTWEIKNVVVK